MFDKKDLLDIASLSVEEIVTVLDRAREMDAIVRSTKESNELRGKSVFLTFYENSTRTASSFEHAVKLLGGNCVKLDVGTSSVKKGENLTDTCATLAALGADAIVMRHSLAGAPHFVAKKLPAVSVLNAGDGQHAHPTQCLLDLYTIVSHCGKDLRGLKVCILGDIKHSRVARSDMSALVRMGAQVRVAGPNTLLPQGLEQYGVTVCPDAESAIEGCDVVMLLRLQLERQTAGIIPSIKEYAAHWQLNAKRLALAAPHAIVMHPGPINRGAEIASEVADSTQSVILEQVYGGLCVRMAALDLLINRKRG